jgi:hypothetical protein
MDKHSIKALKKTVADIEGFIEKCNNPSELITLNEARDMFIRTIAEWEEFRDKQVGMTKEELKELMLKLVENDDLEIEIEDDIEHWGDVNAKVSVKLYGEEILRKSQTVYHITDEEN